MGMVVDHYRFAAAAPSFVPTDIAGCVLWLDASDTATITESSGAVTQWDDKSANGYDVVKESDGARPTTGSTSLNGLNTLSFDGGDYLRQASNSPLNNSSDGSWTIFAVARTTTVGTDGVIIDSDNQGGTRVAQYLRRNANRMSAVGFDSSNFYFTEGTAGSVAVNTPYVFRSVSTGTGTLQVFTNGTGSTAANYTTTQHYVASNGFAVGRFWNAGGSFWTGDIAEIIAYNSDLSSGDIEDVEDYLADKWGITI